MLSVKKFKQKDYDEFAQLMSFVDGGCDWWVNEKTGQGWVGNFGIDNLIYVSTQISRFNDCFY